MQTQQTNKVVVVLGDGNLNERNYMGRRLSCCCRKLDNLVAVVDRNQFQANIRTEELIPLESMKFEAFGWNAHRVNGHDFEAMDITFKSVKLSEGKPNVVIADTSNKEVKDLTALEARADR